MLCSEVQILRKLIDGYRNTGVFGLCRVDVLARANISWGSLLWRGKSWRNLNRRRPRLVILTREKNEVVGGSSLKLLVCNGLQVLSIILSDTGVVFSNNDIG